MGLYESLDEVLLEHGFRKIARVERNATLSGMTSNCRNIIAAIPESENYYGFYIIENLHRKIGNLHRIIRKKYGFHHFSKVDKENLSDEINHYLEQINDGNLKDMVVIPDELKKDFYHIYVHSKSDPSE